TEPSASLESQNPENNYPEDGGARERGRTSDSNLGWSPLPSPCRIQARHAHLRSRAAPRCLVPDLGSLEPALSRGAEPARGNRGRARRCGGMDAAAGDGGWAHGAGDGVAGDADRMGAVGAVDAPRGARAGAGAGGESPGAGGAGAAGGGERVPRLGEFDRDGGKGDSRGGGGRAMGGAQNRDGAVAGARGRAAVDAARTVRAGGAGGGQAQQGDCGAARDQRDDGEEPFKPCLPEAADLRPAAGGAVGGAAWARVKQGAGISFRLMH